MSEFLRQVGTMQETIAKPVANLSRGKVARKNWASEFVESQELKSALVRPRNDNE